MSTSPTSFRIIDSYKNDNFTNVIERQGKGFSVTEKSGKECLKCSNQIDETLNESAIKNQRVVVVVRVDKNDFEDLAGVINPVYERIGRSLARIEKRKTSSPAVELPDVRLAIDSTDIINKIPATVTLGSQQTEQSVNLKKIDILEYGSKPELAKINRQFQNLTGIPVINCEKAIASPEEESFDVQHPTAIILNNFDKLFKIEPAKTTHVA